MEKRRVAINGFGRIGRLSLRAFEASAKKYNFDIIAINDLQDIDVSIHLLKYDSVHGRFDGNIQKISSSEFVLNGKRIIYISENLPNKLPWKELNVDLVLECTGAFKTKELCNLHIEAGARKVLVSHPLDDADRTVIYGVNHDSLLNEEQIVSNASCTTNCLAHVINAIYKEVKILNGFATTVHSYTGDQRLIDTNHKDLRRSRAAASSIIPTSTGVTKAIEKIFPELLGKLSGFALRVPTPNVSLINFTFSTTQKIVANDICQMIIKYSSTVSEKIFTYTNDPLVSIDLNHSPSSAIVDLSLVKVVDGTLGHISAWYDNEWGFSNRMLDTAHHLMEITFRT
ncbi:MAG: type I glyceraldehyde-3-phosphate dehydrogenase [Holosporaceae bacterium]|jgi:glyceraldehyde 3-phosphate dehydrogenase|nr:type I glyceraldehyde-3-phosphate dehydrogenase [Holosporaceae bacterium]